MIRFASLAMLVVAAAACRPNIPMPDVTVSTDEAQVARGKYLANHVTGCVGCHSQRDWTKLNGPIVAGTEFGGSNNLARDDGFPESFSFGAANLTPHFLKDWTDGEIARAIAFGQAKDGHGLFPLMPYMEYREHISKEDLAAVVAYLRTLQPIEHSIPERKFPMPGFVLDGMPQHRDLRAKTPSPGDPDYPKYITGVAGCLACHTGADERGNLVGVPYAGGRKFPMPAPAKGDVFSANLTPDEETGLGKWTKEQFIARFKMSTLDAVRAQPVEAGGYNSMMPWWAYSGMTEQDLGAIYDFLRALPATKNKIEKNAKSVPAASTEPAAVEPAPVEPAPAPAPQ